MFRGRSYKDTVDKRMKIRVDETSQTVEPVYFCDDWDTGRAFIQPTALLQLGDIQINASTEGNNVYYDPDAYQTFQLNAGGSYRLVAGEWSQCGWHGHYPWIDVFQPIGVSTYYNLHMQCAGDEPWFRVGGIRARFDLLWTGPGGYWPMWADDPEEGFGPNLWIYMVYFRARTDLLDITWAQDWLISHQYTTYEHTHPQYRVVGGTLFANGEHTFSGTLTADPDLTWQWQQTGYTQWTQFSHGPWSTCEYPSSISFDITLRQDLRTGS